MIKSNTATLKIQSDYVPYNKAHIVTEMIDCINTLTEVYDPDVFLTSYYETPFEEIVVNAFDIEIDLPKYLYQEIYNKYEECINEYNKDNVDLLKVCPQMFILSRLRR